MATNKQNVLKVKLFKFSCEYACQRVLAELIVFSIYTRIKKCRNDVFIYLCGGLNAENRVFL